MNSKKQGRPLHFKIKLFNGNNSKLRRNCVVDGAKLTLRLLFYKRRDILSCQAKVFQGKKHYHNNPMSILVKFPFKMVNTSEGGK